MLISSSRAVPTLLAALVLSGCATQTSDSAADEQAADEAAIVEAKTHGGQAIARLYQDAVRTRGQIDKATAAKLAAFLKGTEQADARRLLQSVVDDPKAPLSADARAVLVAALAGTVVGDVPLDNAVYRVALGTNASWTGDDQLFLKGTGSVQSNTGITGHSRGYAKKADGVLRSSHGSAMPAHVAVPGSVSEAPPVALDAAATAFGLALPYRFDGIAKATFDPKAQYWEGICHAWTYSSLDERINVLIDPDGNAGQRGLWIFGHWISRADLGNWMMGVSNSLSIADAVLVEVFVSPENLLKGVAEYVMTGRRGLRADIWNDTEQGRSEVWNQPIVSASLAVEDVPSTARDAVLAYAKADTTRKLPAVTDVKLARLSALWGAEVSDSHEGPVSLGRLEWNIYVVTEANGRVATGYMAHHLAAKIGGLPETESDALPDYFAYPKHELIDAALAGRPNALLDGALEGPNFRFFVGTVLARGIPEPTRVAFEKELFGRPTPDVAGLRQRFPGIANAYSAAQWKSVFEPKLGPGASFGAVWGMAPAEFPKAYLPKP